MPQELVSRRTRREFQEWLVSWTLRTISDLFDNHEIEFSPLSQEQLPSGQRRSHVECYYASVDWSNPRDVRRMLNVYEDILMEIPTTEEERKQKLIRYLEKDGYVYDSERIVSQKLDTALVEAIPTVGLDTKHLYIYVNRINASINTDPSLAIGSTKELIEATLKTILNGCSFEYDDKKDDIPKLLKKVQKVLKLTPDEVDDAKKGAEVIKKVLSNLGSIAVGLAELRNLYGSGHGRDKIQGITARHAKLVVGSGTALCTFLLETYEHRDNIKLLHLKSQAWQNLHTLAFTPPRKVRCVAFHPEKRIIASGSEDHIIRIWNLDTGKTIHEYKRYYHGQNSGDVTSLIFSHDGKFIISTGFVSSAKHLQDLELRKLQIIDWTTGDIIGSLPSFSQLRENCSVALCPRRDIIALDSLNNLELYDLKLKQHLKTLKGHSTQITAFTFNSDGTTIFSASENGNIRMCNWQDNDFLEDCINISAKIDALSVSPDSQFVAIGCEDNKIRLFNLVTRELYVELEGHVDTVWSLTFSPNGQLLASGSQDDTVKVWHVKTKELLHNLEGGSCWKGVLSISFSQNGEFLAAGLEGGEIKVWQQI